MSCLFVMQAFPHDYSFEFQAAYHYTRSIYSVHPFNAANESLLALGELNRQRLRQLEAKVRAGPAERAMGHFLFS